MLDLQPIKDRLAAVTPGPWRCVRDDPNEYVISIATVNDEILITMPNDVVCSTPEDDANLIANAPQDLAALVAEVERLRDENIRLSNQGPVRVAAPPRILAKKDAEIKHLNSELDKYKTALQKLFSVTPTTNNMPRELYYLKGFKEDHEEALKLAKELLWAKKDEV